jgi:hypothetical protein
MTLIPENLFNKMETKANPLIEDLLWTYKEQANIKIEPIFARSINGHFNGFVTVPLPGAFKTYTREIRIHPEDNNKFNIGDYYGTPKFNGIILPFMVSITGISEFTPPNNTTVVKTLTLDFHT